MDGAAWIGSAGGTTGGGVVDSVQADDFSGNAGQVEMNAHPELFVVLRSPEHETERFLQKKTSRAQNRYQGERRTEEAERLPQTLRAKKEDQRRQRRLREYTGRKSVAAQKLSDGGDKRCLNHPTEHPVAGLSRAGDLAHMDKTSRLCILAKLRVTAVVWGMFRAPDKAAPSLPQGFLVSGFSQRIRPILEARCQFARRHLRPFHPV
ncbi:unnamed protein product [Calicophoron daubneyi]|uniref:Uncharacterized protein n=1 Tax=Calicophoron daubneyi TaxID=300641 RepID=A0AAV2TF89_CALDB